MYCHQSESCPNNPIPSQFLVSSSQSFVIASGQLPDNTQVVAVSKATDVQDGEVPRATDVQDGEVGNATDVQDGEVPRATDVKDGEVGNAVTVFAIKHHLSIALYPYHNLFAALIAVFLTKYILLL